MLVSLEVQLYICIDFGCHSGSLLGPTLASFCVFSVILGTEMGGSFQVHVFSDPGMEMMLECSGCMCLNHRENCGFREIPLFQLFMNLVSRGKVFGVILHSVGGLGRTFSHLLGSWREA